MEQNKKLKLLSSLRENKRYLALVVKKTKNVKKCIGDSILKFLGLLGYAKSNPMIIETGKKGRLNYAILSVNRSYTNDIKSALILKSIKCIGVSGTIKGLRRFLNTNS